jgi:site-specific DNA-methyltransferase (adenine-specific)
MLDRTTQFERLHAINGKLVMPDAELLTAEERAYVTATATGLIFADDTPFDLWLALTERLLEAEKRINWYIADAINFGENNRTYGEKYSQAIEITGSSYQALATIAWVGRQVDISRRRENVSFATFAEVAPLPPAIADELLDQQQQAGWSQKELREQVKVKRAEIRHAELRALPAPKLAIPDAHVVVADALTLPLQDATVDLIVTSPPYALEKSYDTGDIVILSWRQFMTDALTEAFRVSKPGARLALNVPLDTMLGGARPTYAQAVAAAQRAGWTYRSTITWNDDQLGKSTARGSVDSAASPYIYVPSEMIVLCSKGEWSRPEPKDRPSDIAHADWLEWTNGDWRFPGESQSWEHHPAPFPLELPRRLVHLLSFPGDLVLDPFCGSGTTLVAALRAGRRVIGCDRSPFYVASSLRRLAREVHV